MGSVLAVVTFGLLTMFTFSGEGDFFSRQIIWVGVGLLVYFLLAQSDLTFIRGTPFVVVAYTLSIVTLLALFVMPAVQGAQSWFLVGPIAIQPSDPIKLVVILLLAKYFSRRHIEIANFRHIFVSGVYMSVLMLLVLLQPDLGTSAIYGALWLGVVFVSGISKRHVAAVLALLVLVGAGAWSFALQDYQKNRIIAYLHPTNDIQGIGYNAYQSTVAIGSGELVGKAVGYGTQSELKFLPEYETDFIFAAFAEEWGFLGVTILFVLYTIIVLRIIESAWKAGTNFDAFFSVGVAVLFTAHILIHAGMNMGLLPVTGTTIPFMSYGGSHLLTSFAALGVVTSMRRHARDTHRDESRE
jgi:rod shape determining protein RodA